MSIFLPTVRGDDRVDHQHAQGCAKQQQLHIAQPWDGTWAGGRLWAGSNESGEPTYVPWVCL